MPAKKEDKAKKEIKEKKPKVSVKPANNSKEILVEKVPVEKEKSTKVEEEKEVVDMPDEEMKKAIEKAAKEGDKSKYIETIGRRKTASARIRLFTQGKKGIIVNGKPYTEFFTLDVLQKTVEDPMEKLKCLDKFGVTVIVKGGGPTGQAEAIRHGIARALVKLNPYFKKRLKKFGFLTRDSRMRERKKPGLKRARRAPQWSKR